MRCARGLRRRTEQNVDRGAVPRHQIPIRDGHVILADLALQRGVPVPRRNQNPSPQNGVAVLRFLHLDRAQAVQPLGESSRELLGHVLDNDDPGNLRKRFEYNTQGSVPPVEAPMQTTVSALRANSARAKGVDRTASTFLFAAIWSLGAGEAADFGGSRLRLARAAALTTSQMRTLDSSRNCRVSMRGFGMMSTAPASSACIMVVEHSTVRLEHITTGTGCCAMSFFKKVMPSIRGISTSSVITSGISCGNPARRGIGIARRADNFDVRVGAENVGQSPPDGR